MAIKAIMFVMLFAIVFCRVESASRWGVIGGYAVSDCDESHTRPPLPPPIQQRTSPQKPKTKEIQSSDSPNSHHQKSDSQSGHQKPDPPAGIRTPDSQSGDQKSDSSAGNPKLDSSTTCACKVDSCSSGNEEPGSSSGNEKSGYGMLNVVLSICVSVLVTYAVSKLLEQDSVLLVQVALDGDTKKIEQDLGEIVTQSRTKRGLHMLLSNIVSCIYRYPGSCFAAYFRVEKTGKYIGAGWEKCFDEAYSELRKKVNPFVCANDSGDNELAIQNTYLLVSILVAASGIRKLPDINSYSDLDRVLCYLTSICSRDIKAVKMLWATRHSIEDFPKLRRLRS